MRYFRSFFHDPRFILFALGLSIVVLVLLWAQFYYWNGVKNLPSLRDEQKNVVLQYLSEYTELHLEDVKVTKHMRYVSQDHVVRGETKIEINGVRSIIYWCYEDNSIKIVESKLR